MKNEKIDYMDIPEKGYIIAKCNKCGKTVFHFGYSKKSQWIPMYSFQKNYSNKMPMYGEKEISKHIQEKTWVLHCKCGNEIWENKYYSDVRIDQILGTYIEFLGIVWEGIDVSYSKEVEKV